MSALEPLLKDDAELLPLRCAEAELWFLHVWRQLDALNEDASDITRFPSSGRIIRIGRHQLRPDVVGNHNFFRLSAMPRGPLYIQQPVAEAIEPLRHVCFKQIWGPARGTAGATDWDWRNPPKVVSVADIQATSDERLWQLIYLCEIEAVRGKGDDEYSAVKAWTPGLQMLWATQLVEDEVNNGGFNQYFFNSSGQYAREAIEGFQLIGAVERAQIVQDALDQFLKEKPSLRLFHEGRTMEDFMESYKHTKLGELDRRWYAAPEFFSARTAYIRAHPEEFVLPARPA